MGKTGIIRPDLHFLLRHPAHFIALGFGSGLPPKAPGTFGTLAALPLYALMLALGCCTSVIVGICVITFLVGWWAAHVTGKNLGVHDHGAIVVDEIVAMWLVLLFVPGGISYSEMALWWAVAFGLFRLFDIWKPWPIRVLDAKVPGGFGVMLDDLLAAVYAIVVMVVLEALVGFWL